MCDRFPVTADGIVNGGFAGGFAGGFGGGGTAGGFGGAGGSTPIILEGERVTMRLVAPLTSCPTDDLRANIEVLAPDSSTVEHTFTGPTRAADAHVEGNLEFTVTAPGLYVVRAVFEPSLGVRTTTVNVIGTFSEARATAVPLPTGFACAEVPWPVTGDTIACERSGAQISLLSSDAGVTTFDGTDLVVVGDVLWSETATRTLERREWSDGGLTVTRSIPGFSATPIRGLHTRTTAIRKRANGDLVGVALPDGGLLESFFSSSDFTSGVFFYENDGTARVAGSFSCGDCLNSLVAFDDGVAWQQFGSGSQVNGYKRPITAATPFSTPNFVLQVEPRPGLPIEPMERWPLWVDPANRATISILIRPKYGALEWSAWPRDRVLRVGPTHAVVRTSVGFLVAPLDR